MFDNADYQRASARLDVPIAHIMAMAAVESSGETFWTLGTRLVVPVRFEAHLFGKFTDYRFNTDHPDLSCVEWTPSLAAVTKAGAWDQVARAAALDHNAAYEASSFGAFQILGMHARRLDYPSVDEFVASMSRNGDDGQMDAFVAFVASDRALLASLRIGAWLDVERRYNGGGQGGAYAARLQAAAALYAAEDAPAAPRVLRKGDKGADVAALQMALGITPDGDFGPLTDQAVRLFQADRGLLVDGVVGAMTRGALGI
jgi:murein L,D-transpeptidase YcbB/YkuD